MNITTILAFFQKFHRECCLLLMVVLGLASGLLVTTVVGTALRPETSLEPAGRLSPRAATPQISDQDLSRILQQNIFDPSARGSRFATYKSSRTDNSAQPLTRKELKLIGTLVADPDSTALIEVDKRIKLFHLEEELPGGGRIEAIERNQVTIRNDDRTLTVLTLLDEASTQTRPRQEDSAATGIRSVGNNRWEVAQSTATAAREDIGQQLRLAKIEPRLIDGQTDGFLVSMLNKRSLLTKMGLQRGDVLMQVNNMKLDSPEKALQILQQLREARQLSVDIERAGKSMTFIYEIK